MKKFLIIICVILIDINILFAEEPMDCVSATTPLTNEIGGLYKPATGNLHVLLVFAQFSDDNYLPTNSYWQTGSAPANMNNWIDETWSSNPTQGSLTHYFNVM